MICQKCGQNEAEVRFIQNINGQKSETYLCGECASSNGIAFTPISFANFFQSFFEPSAEYDEARTLKCNKCGLTLDKIKKVGKAGCEQCYEVFESHMKYFIKNVQAGETHKGRCPKSADDIITKREINTLRNKLAEAVMKEEYEEAAKFRDMIKEIERRRNDGKVV